MNGETKFHVSVMDARLKKVKNQRDELINDITDIKRKAEAFDEIVKSLDKSDSPEDFGELVWEILLDCGAIHIERQ